MHKTFRRGVLLAALALAAVGCGGSDSTDAASRSPNASTTLFAAAVGVDAAAQAPQRGPRIGVSHAESSPPLFLLPRPSGPQEENEHPVRHHPNLKAAAPQPDPVLQSVAQQVTAPTALLDFFGQGNTISPSTITGTPPDTNGAVGPNHFVQTVNGGIAVWDKQGHLLFGSKLLNVLWTGYIGTNPGNACATENDGDPVVLYDQLADRWLITQFSVPNTKGPDWQCVAVSQTADPTGSYYLYDFQYPFFNDYGKFGVWPDAYYASFNNFGANYAGADLCAWDRASMLAGQPATQHCFQQSTAVFGVLPASLDGKVPPPRGEPGFFLEMGSNALNLWKLHADFVTPANSTLTGPTSIPVAAFTAACSGGGTCISQPNGNALDSLADRLMFRLAYRNFGTFEALVVNHTITANTNKSGIRWYEIRNPNGTPSVFQQGTFAPNDGSFRWMGSIAQDQAGDFLVGYSLSSTSIKPSIAWAGRLATDTVGTMGQGETITDSGTGDSTTASRWGDYSSMTVDPADDCTFWYTQELFLTTNEFTWDTRIATFKFPSCGANDFSIGVSPSTQSIRQGAAAAYTISTNATLGTAETIVLGVQDLPAGVTGSFSPSSVTAGGTSTLTLTAGASAPPTTSPVQFTVIGTAPSALHAATASASVGSALPAVSVTTPANGATVSGLAPITVAATPASGTTLSSLSITIDGSQVASGSSSPQTFNWDTTALGNGTTHTITATAVDADGGTATSSTAIVTVKNAPTASVTSPANGATVVGTVSISAAGVAARGTTLSSLSIGIDGSQVASGGSSPQTFNWDTTALGSGTAHTITATAVDADGLQASSSISVTVTSDFTISIATTRQVASAGGPGATYAISTAAIGAPQSIQLAVSGLPAGVTATLSANPVTAGTGATLTLTASPGTPSATTPFTVTGSTAALPAGHGANASLKVVQPPAVAISGPAAGATLSGLATVTATASSDPDVGLALIDVYDGATKIGTGTTSPLAIAWDTTAVANGAHALTAVATDTAGGQTVSAAVTVQVGNDFSLGTSAPTAIVTAGSSPAQLLVQTTALGGAESIALSVDGLPAGVTATLGSTLLAPGNSTTLTVAASPTAVAGAATLTLSGKTTSATHQATVGLTVLVPPAATITAPAAQATVSGIVQISAAAVVSPGTSLASLEVDVDGAAVATPSSSTPTTVSWNTASVSNGTHTLAAVARDASGNVTTSAPVTVQVANQSANAPHGGGGCSSTGSADLFALAGLLQWLGLRRRK
jgi:hypothetical protein